MDNDIKLPYVPLPLIEHLENEFNREHCLSLRKDVRNNDELVGTMRGINIVIEYLKAVATANEG